MCDISFDDSSCPRVWRESMHRARKNYRCTTCGGSIPAGTHYRCHFSVSDDGEACSERACLFCAAAHDEFSEEHDDISVSPGYFPVLLDECIVSDDAPKWEAMLAAMVQRAVAYEDLYGAAA